MSQSFEAQMKAARKGSTTALGTLLEAYRPYLHMLADKALPLDLRAKAGISDLVQETYAEAHRDFGQFEGKTEAELAGWLAQILRNNLANLAQRYRQTEKRRVDREISLENMDQESDKRMQVPSPIETPSGQVLRQEMASAMEGALKRLPADYQRVIELRHRENRSFDDIATAMGRSKAAVRKLWARAIERWREETKNGAGQD